MRISDWSSDVCSSDLPPHSAVAAGDVILGTGFARVGEDFRRVAIFDQIAEMENRRLLADARSLLHIVGDDHYRIAPAQYVAQFLDLGGGDRVQRRAWLVHQDHLGLARDAASDPTTLLLAAQQSGAHVTSALLHHFPPPHPP